MNSDQRYPHELDPALLRQMLANGLQIAREIDERLDPAFEGQNASRIKLVSLGAREWKNVTALRYALRLDSMIESAARAASFAVEAIPRLESLTPWRYFEWFGISALAQSEHLMFALVDLNEAAFDGSGAAPSTAAKTLADVWRRAFSTGDEPMPEEEFLGLIDRDGLDLATTLHLKTLWDATCSVLSRNPDRLGNAIRLRAEFIQDVYGSLEDRYLPEALLDLPLVAVLQLARRFNVRVLAKSPYVPDPLRRWDDFATHPWVATDDQPQ